MQELIHCFLLISILSPLFLSLSSHFLPFSMRSSHTKQQIEQNWILLCGMNDRTWCFRVCERSSDLMSPLSLSFSVIDRLNEWMKESQADWKKQRERDFSKKCFARSLNLSSILYLWLNESSSSDEKEKEIQEEREDTEREREDKKRKDESLKALSNRFESQLFSSSSISLQTDTMRGHTLDHSFLSFFNLCGSFSHVQHYTVNERLLSSSIMCNREEERQREGERKKERELNRWIKFLPTSVTSKQKSEPLNQKKMQLVCHKLMYLITKVTFNDTDETFSLFQFPNFFVEKRRGRERKKERKERDYLLKMIVIEQKKMSKSRLAINQERKFG